ncbi:MAG: hypothetical protein EXR27_17515 [Betaproteobacteria bacterium]|nr:hypothetical protein [Betaproteobacteria bacterium]
MAKHVEIERRGIEILLIEAKNFERLAAWYGGRLSQLQLPLTRSPQSPWHAFEFSWRLAAGKSDARK